MASADVPVNYAIKEVRKLFGHLQTGAQYHKPLQVSCGSASHKGQCASLTAAIAFVQSTKQISLQSG